MPCLSYLSLSLSLSLSLYLSLSLSLSRSLSLDLPPLPKLFSLSVTRLSRGPLHLAHQASARIYAPPPSILSPSEAFLSGSMANDGISMIRLTCPVCSKKWQEPQAPRRGEMEEGEEQMNGRGGKAWGEGMEGEREGEAPLEKNSTKIRQQLAQHCWSTSHLAGSEAAEGRGQAMNLTGSGKGWARVNKRPRQAVQE